MTTSQRKKRSRLFWGVLLVTAGVALLLDPFVDSIHITVGRLWPLFFIALGLSKMVDGQGRRSTGGLLARRARWVAAAEHIVRLEI